MEDIQDGKKTSIQDGVTEDPAIPEEFTALIRSGTAKTYLSTKITDPEIHSEAKTKTSSAITATISSSVVGVVT